MQIGVLPGFSHQYEDPNSLMCKKLRPVEPLLKKGVSLLDVGAGTGEFVAIVKDRFEQMVALDSTEESVEILKGRFGSIEKVTVMKGDAATVEHSVRNPM